MSEVVAREIAERRPGTEGLRAEAGISLKAGDELTRSEFERRYSAHPNIKKAELIDGIVRMPSPVRYELHGKPHGALLGSLMLYAAHTPGVGMAPNATVRLDSRNEVQPDALLRIEPAEMGQSSVDADGYINGAPELVAEISASGARFDLREKLEAYLDNGVREYIVWQTRERRVDWFERVGGNFQALHKGTGGAVQSRVFPGLRLALNALVAGDAARALAAAHMGLGSAAHREFLAKLNGPRAVLAAPP